MKIENQILKKELPAKSQMEFSLGSGEGIEKMENWLGDLIGKEEAEQCVFALRSMAGMGFANQCKDATKELGNRLAERFGGEESFFELAPSASYSDAKSLRPIDKTASRDDYHSVGLLEFSPPGKPAFSLAIDMNYGHVAGKEAKDTVLALYYPGPKHEALQELKGHYGGDWKVEFEYDKETGNFVYNDDAGQLQEAA